ncbi:3-oxoacyl-[acyl-carrier-protein] reductase [Caproiciproducens galactitolivorans]|uniref:3-oxoacyl-[acyl-carrier-protein] reductase n=1 Tax=Caproiciproducens galactitolivorans TaxID=642589 RepID=A0A4Z0XZA7_9FIRM|nr:3-oxoacyl-[acyl-carrier-protein] reductase [Caproiciproducens galactitolivorans]QEY35255.1 3-oxoacyl-[acyl-carrier-protein] reductase [Caproiciproducens galactitolivorans]TGJ76949.1 3-oxoacyl-[acyl-carrier-protein] reductase FabG [Caproiciproducens galactitolivorans]
MLKGKTAVVTGGSRGIGKAIALKLAQEGADVAVVYAGNEAAAKETCETIESYGVKTKAYRCDVSDDAQTKALVDAVLADFGGIDILVNNAGIVRDGLLLAMKEEDFDAVLDTNLKGAFHMIKHTYRNFMKKRGGRIINIASVSGIVGNPGQANYSAAKAGLIGLTKATAKELAGRNVTCNAIAPGFIETDMTAGLADKAKEAAVSAIPLKRMGRPEDVAELAAFLAGDGAGYLTGEVIKVDGGLCM